MTIKNLVSSPTDDLRPEYDFSTLKGGVRGKYFDRATVGTTLVLLEPDVAEAFPDGPSINRALRAHLRAAQSQRGKLPNKRLQPTATRKALKKRGRRRG